MKGVAGRILWKVLREHAANGRTAFTNRELRLDEQLGLPAGNENLEARLLLLRKRLDGIGGTVQLERVGRGRFELRIPGRRRCPRSRPPDRCAQHTPPPTSKEGIQVRLRTR